MIESMECDELFHLTIANEMQDGRVARRSRLLLRNYAMVIR